MRFVSSARIRNFGGLVNMPAVVRIKAAAKAGQCPRMNSWDRSKVSFRGHRLAAHMIEAVPKI